MIVWTPAVLSVLYACVLYFCSAQLSMFHVDRHSRNTLIIIIMICLNLTWQPSPLYIIVKPWHLSPLYIIVRA